jgi:uncharacterized RDD family membrane protein YckC
MTYDALPVAALFFLSSIILLVLHGGKPAASGSAWAFFTMAFYWVVAGGYAVISWRRGGQTMGMRPWRLMVLTQEGKNAGLKALCLRYVVVSLSGGVALLWCLVDAQKRGLHDVISGTLVVRKQATLSVGKEKRSDPAA